MQAELDPVLTLVETYWAQRDKIQWLGLADRNTKIRRARHHIRHCEDYSGLVLLDKEYIRNFRANILRISSHRVELPDQVEPLHQSFNANEVKSFKWSLSLKHSLFLESFFRALRRSIEPFISDTPKLILHAKFVDQFRPILAFAMSFIRLHIRFSQICPWSGAY